MAKKTKIVLEQGRSKEYRVAKLVNRCEPVLDSWISRKKVEELIESDENLSVEIIEKKK